MERSNYEGIGEMNSLEIMYRQIVLLETTLTNDSSRRITKRIKAMVECMIDEKKPAKRVRPQRLRGEL